MGSILKQLIVPSIFIFKTENSFEDNKSVSRGFVFWKLSYLEKRLEMADMLV